MDPSLPPFLVATFEHRRTKVRRDNLPIVSQVTSKGEGEIGCATTDIEEARSGRYPAASDCPPAPVVMQTKAQHSIKYIIMLSNSGKHVPHSVSHGPF
jgi:hypothetical protein